MHKFSKLVELSPSTNVFGRWAQNAVYFIAKEIQRFSLTGKYCYYHSFHFYIIHHLASSMGKDVYQYELEKLCE